MNFEEFSRRYLHLNSQEQDQLPFQLTSFQMHCLKQIRSMTAEERQYRLQLRPYRCRITIPLLVSLLLDETQHSG